MTKIGFLRFIFHISLALLVVLSLYPGSLMGLLFYGDLSRQPDLIKNPFGTAINHFFSYTCISLLGFFAYIRSSNFKKLFYGLLFLSIFLEAIQSILPVRTFQLVDLTSNILGVLVAYFLVKLYLYFIKL